MLLMSTLEVIFNNTHTHIYMSCIFRVYFRVDDRNLNFGVGIFAG